MVLSILSLLLYPFLWAWTVIGTLWFRRAKDCVSYFKIPCFMLFDIPLLSVALSSVNGLIMELMH